MVEMLRGRMWIRALAACAVACVALGLAAPAVADDAAPLADAPAAPVGDAASADPYVQLDAAKTVLADGRLEEAQRQLAQIPADQAEPYVDEEVAFQQLLLDGSFLQSTEFVMGELVRNQMADTDYWRWLYGQRDKYAGDFSSDARRWLALTAGGPHLTFVRFKLPEVTEEHLSDVQFYSDPQVLRAAVENWGQGKEGLGHGLILAQTRVALVLAAARHYDLAEPSSTIKGVARRLSAGVPLYMPRMLDWVAELALRCKDAGNGLEQLSRGCDAQIVAQTAGLPNDALRHRAQDRLNPPPVKPAVAKPVKKKSAKRRKRH